MKKVITEFTGPAYLTFVTRCNTRGAYKVVLILTDALLFNSRF